MPEKISVATINVNGVRAAAKKGLIEWIVEHSPDIIALQEVRAETSDLVEIFQEIEKQTKTKWHILHDAASAKGRAGVAVISKLKPTASRTSLGAKNFD